MLDYGIALADRESRYQALQDKQRIERAAEHGLESLRSVSGFTGAESAQSPPVSAFATPKHQQGPVPAAVSSSESEISAGSAARPPVEESLVESVAETPIEPPRNRGRTHLSLPPDPANQWVLLADEDDKAAAASPWRSLVSAMGYALQSNIVLFVMFLAVVVLLPQRPDSESRFVRLEASNQALSQQLTQLY